MRRTPCGRGWPSGTGPSWRPEREPVRGAVVRMVWLMGASGTGWLLSAADGRRVARRRLRAQGDGSPGGVRRDLIADPSVKPGLAAQPRHGYRGHDRRRRLRPRPPHSLQRSLHAERTARQELPAASRSRIPGRPRRVHVREAQILSWCARTRWRRHYVPLRDHVVTDRDAGLARR